MLTILGVIMYLRLGWVVGHAGLFGAVLIILLAHAVSVPTSLSIASLASNRSIGGGGVYYIISRSLGLPIGGAIGGALFLATALGTSIYVIGFAETVNTLIQSHWPELWGNDIFHIQVTGTLTCVLLTVLTVISANLAIRVQFFIMGAIGLSIIALVLGTSPAPVDTVQLWPVSASMSMETVFAIFFPAVTGFTAGVAMSGDLRKPNRDIPLGTLAAVGTGLVIYLCLAVFLGLNVQGDVLRAYTDIWSKMAIRPEFVLAGVWGATLSSAIGSLLGAPRILQALALDGIGPNLLSRGSGPNNEPRVATIATFMIAEAGILVGDLDLVARVLTMLFLTTYGTLNLASGLERWANPDFRPRFRSPAVISWLGALVCFATMFKVDATAMVGALTALALLYIAIKQRQLELETNNIWSAIWQSLVRSGLYRLRMSQDEKGTWRPNMLVFGGHPSVRPHLLKLAQWMVQEYGMLTNFMLTPTTRPVRNQATREANTNPMLHLPAVSGFEDFAFHSVFHTHRECTTVDEGVRLAADWFGLVGMEPNAVMLGWPRRPEKREIYARLVHDLMLRDLNVLLLETDPDRGFGRRRKLDVWWGHNQSNGGLMLLLAHYIQQNAAWARARVRIVTVVSSPDEMEPRREALKALLSAGRVRAEIIVMDVSREAITPLQLLRVRSSHADLVLMGMAIPKDFDGWVLSQHVKTEGLGAVLRVYANQQSAGGQPLGVVEGSDSAEDASPRQGSLDLKPTNSRHNPIRNAQPPDQG
ncbi:MAG TPA: Na-K-Cl cotransporter [Myxococcales bacterium]|nr:Na-K-Cl cotransporter [Myxococcales bacterium]